MDNDNGTLAGFRDLLKKLQGDRTGAANADAIDPVISSSDTAKNPNEKRGMKEEAGNYFDGGDVPDPTIDQGFLDKLNQGTAMTPEQDPQTPSLSDTTSAVNNAPDTNYGFYGDVSADKRAALYKSLLDQQRSPGNLIAQGIGGLGDAFSALGGKSTDFQNQVAGVAAKNTENRIGAMDTQRGQKMQDMQANQEGQLNDPRSPLSSSMRSLFQANGMQVGSNMPGSLLLKISPDLGNFALKSATLGVQNKVAEGNIANQQLERTQAELNQKNTAEKQAADIANAKAERDQKQQEINTAADEKAATHYIVDHKAAMAARARLAQGSSGRSPIGQTIDHPSGAKITRIN